MGTKYSNQHKIENLNLINETRTTQKEEIVNKNSFEYLTVIGRGGFGKVWKVFQKKYKKIYAMKEMSKTKIIDKNSIQSIKNEKDLLSKMYHPFIINMHYAFQDRDNLYIIMDYLIGGDLRYHFCIKRNYTEEQGKFFIACLILSLEYIHNNNIIHRDLKPENLIFDNKGYLKLTDFGIAKIYNRNIDNSKETSGTPGYMSPEVLCGLNHNFCVDYYALGIIAYEIMLGDRPYKGTCRREVKQQVLSKQVFVTKKNLSKKKWSNDSADFINKCIQRKPCNRLGYIGINQLKEHPWLKYFNWKDLYVEKMKAPYIPDINEENFDRKYCNYVDKPGVRTLDRYRRIEMSDKYKISFIDFEYYDRKKDDNLKKILEEENILNNKSGYNNNDNSTCDISFTSGKSKNKSRNIIIHSRNSQRSIEDLNSLILKKNFKTYVNPHLIYKVLDEKEKDGFTTVNENIDIKKNKKITFNGIRNRYNKTNNLLSVSVISNFTTNMEEKIQNKGKKNTIKYKNNM